MSLAHTLITPNRDDPVTVGRSYDETKVTLNFGKVASVSLTHLQLLEAVAAIQAEIDAHMAAHPVIARSA